MKKILFAITIVMMVGLFANAQSDGFFKSWYNDNYNDRTGSGDTPGIIMPSDDIFGAIDDANGAPLGSGLLIMTALGAGYVAVRKKRR